MSVCQKKGGGFLMMKSDKSEECWGKMGLVCVGGEWTTPEAPYSGHAGHAGCHCGWWMWVDGQVGRAWPRAQALTVTRSDTPSPPALTATSGHLQIRPSALFQLQPKSLQFWGSESKTRRETLWTNVVPSAPTRRQAAVVFTQRGGGVHLQPKVTAAA